MLDVRVPSTSGYGVLLIRDVITELNMFGSIQTEPGLFEGSLDGVWVQRSLCEKLVELLFGGVFAFEGGRRGEGTAGG